MSSWMFDVSSLMVLIGEPEEERLRAFRRSLSEVLQLVPVAGIQSYLKPYDRVADSSKLQYFSPFGRKWAPLRNMELDSVINHLGLLRDGKFGVFEIPANGLSHSKYHIISWAWTVFTWLAFGGLMVFCRLGPTQSWVGITNCVVLIGWSVILRTIGLIIIRTREKKDSSGKAGSGQDAVFFLGKRSAAVVIRGSRRDIKRLTTAKLEYDEGESKHIQNSVWQYFTRFGTIAVLLHIFVTVPNGTTYDQLAFVILNALAQINVFLGLHLNTKAALSSLKRIEDPGPEMKWYKDKIMANRTQVYGSLLRYFYRNGIQDQGWVDLSEMLPKTSTWETWKKKVVEEGSLLEDPKVLWDRLDKEEREKPETKDPSSTLVEAIIDNGPTSTMSGSK